MVEVLFQTVQPIIVGEIFIFCPVIYKLVENLKKPFEYG